MREPNEELAALSAALRGRLDREKARGRTHLKIGALPPPPAPRLKSSAGSPGTGPAPRQAAPASPASPAPSARGKKLPQIDIEPLAPDHEEQVRALEELGQEASTCKACGLCTTRTQVVFSRGRARNRVMFIGEAPGANEDREGLPFVGRAGRLLDQIIDATGFRREEIYVANILKCRPPENRDPRPEEIEACTPWLQRQIELIRPRIICALGRFAAQFLTDRPKVPMGRLRGKILLYRGEIKVLPTYHPAALLRNPQWKRTVWEDMQLLRKEYLQDLAADA